MASVFSAALECSKLKFIQLFSLVLFYWLSEVLWQMFGWSAEMVLVDNDCIAKQIFVQICSFLLITKNWIELLLGGGVVLTVVAKKARIAIATARDPSYCPLPLPETHPITHRHRQRRIALPIAIAGDPSSPDRRATLVIASRPNIEVALTKVDSSGPEELHANQLNNKQDPSRLTT